jgi:uncharacterized LabA/DUF88 family protein
MIGTRVGIFIDGAYFDWVCKDNLGSARIDFEKLANFLAGGKDILRTYYYHCLPYQSNPPTKEESERYSKMSSFFYNLTKLPKFEVRQGKLAYRGINKDDNKPIFEQKRVDIFLGVDLVLLSVKQMISHAVLISGDSDFLPALNVARNEGVSVHLYHGSGECAPHRELWESCDERTPLNQTLVKPLLR